MKMKWIVAAVFLLFCGCATTQPKNEITIKINQTNDFEKPPTIEAVYKVTF